MPYTVVYDRACSTWVVRFVCSFYFRSSNRGSFLEILRWAAKTDPIISSIFEDSAANANYLSHDIQNELIHIMSNEICEEICEEISSMV